MYCFVDDWKLNGRLKKVKNSDYIIEQYRGNKLLRTFTPSADKTYP